MENPEQKIVEEKEKEKSTSYKPEGVTIFFEELKDGVQQFSMDTDDFFHKFKKDFRIKLNQLKSQWKKLFSKGEKEDSHYKLTNKLYRRYKVLERKMRKIESETSETREIVAQIKDDTSQIILDIDHVVLIVEITMEKIDDVENYMKTNLGTDWAKLKYSWEQYKEGVITRGDFIKIGLKHLGKKFLSIFVKTSR